MLAGVRSCFSLSLLLVWFAACLPVRAQINGVPASVTSLGFGGSTNQTPGVRASVTSLGPSGYGNSSPIFGSCCANYFMPANQDPPLFSGRHHHRGDHYRNPDRGYFPLGISEPVYIPYAVPYPVEADDDSPDDVESTGASSPRRPYPADKRAGDRDPARPDYTSAKPAPVASEEPVAAQPSTVLIYKDGRHSDVLNYAIVGDTLFDFGNGRARKILLADLDLPATRRANDDRGVDFQVPASAKGQ